MGRPKGKSKKEGRKAKKKSLSDMIIYFGKPNRNGTKKKLRPRQPKLDDYKN